MFGGRHSESSSSAAAQLAPSSVNGDGTTDGEDHDVVSLTDTYLRTLLTPSATPTRKESWYDKAREKVDVEETQLRKAAMP